MDAEIVYLAEWRAEHESTTLDSTPLDLWSAWATLALTAWLLVVILYARGIDP